MSEEINTAIDEQYQNGEVTAYIKKDFKNEISKGEKYKDCITGYKQLDEKINGLNPGMIILGGGSSAGKTTFALNLAYQICQNGGRAIYYSLEQTTFEITSKLLSRRSEMNRRCDDNIAITHGERNTIKSYSAIEIRQGKANDDIDELLNKLENDIADRLIIRPKPGTDVLSIKFSTIESELKAIKTDAEEPKNNPVIFIDYLQSIEPDEGNADQQRAYLDRILKKLEAVAKSKGLTIFLISSFNRNSYYLPISYESFKETGGIEYTADIILGLQMEFFNDGNIEKILGTPKGKEIVKKKFKEEEAKNCRKIELVCLKNRYGIKDFSCYYDYYPKYDLFAERTEPEYYNHNESTSDNEPKNDNTDIPEGW